MYPFNLPVTRLHLLLANSLLNYFSTTPCSVGWDRGLGYAREPGARFREFRRLFHLAIGARACADTTGSLPALLEAEARQLVICLFREPADFYRHARE